MPEAVIVDGIRTPFVRAGGPMRFTTAAELGRQATRELLYRLDLEPAAIDELIAGNVATPADAPNVARVIALNAGIPQDRIAHSVHRNCASGLEAISQAVERIRAGKARAIVALGVESMSNIPVFWSRRLVERLQQFSQAKSRFKKLIALTKIRPSDLRPQIGLQVGLTDPVSGLMMGDTAEKLAREFGISREEQDRYALQSHQRTTEAWKAGRLAEEAMTMYPEPSRDPVEQDVGPREGQTLEALAKLKPYFDRRFGTVTVGNSCQVTDGAVAVLVMEEQAARAAGYEPLGRLVDYAYAGCDPSRMGLGPVFATAKLLKQTGKSLAEMELIELNEAFAAQVIACMRAFESIEFAERQLGRTEPLGALDPERLNVNGGAIALGHPVGASGARLVLTLLKEMKRRGQHTGLTTMCVGGGQGGAALLER